MPKPKNDVIDKKMKDIFKIAPQEIGVMEQKGSAINPRILAKGMLGLDLDELPR